MPREYGRPSNQTQDLERRHREAARDVKRLEADVRQTEIETQRVRNRIQEVLTARQQTAWRELLEEFGSVTGSVAADQTGPEQVLAEARRFRQLTPVRKAYETAANELAAAEQELIFVVREAQSKASEMTEARARLVELERIASSRNAGSQAEAAGAD